MYFRLLDIFLFRFSINCVKPENYLEFPHPLIKFRKSCMFTCHSNKDKNDKGRDDRFLAAIFKPWETLLFKR